VETLTVRIWESPGVQFPRATRLVIKIRGRKHWLWRAVDNEGEILDFIVQRSRDAKVAYPVDIDGRYC